MNNQVPLPFRGGQVNDYRFKALLFPLFVPVLVFCLLDGVGECDILEGESFKNLLEGVCRASW